MPNNNDGNNINSSSVKAPVDQAANTLRPDTPVFYRCRCPECGEDALKLCGLDVFFRSDFLGVRHDGEFGCGFMKLAGDYHWIILCESCGYEAFNTNELSGEALIDWAADTGQAMTALEFSCPVCGSPYFNEVFSVNRSVRAVYETSENEYAEVPGEVALSYEQVREYGKPFDDIKRSFSTACRKAGLTDFTFHDLRHCAINNLRVAGNDYFKIMAISGHKTISVFKRYNLVTAEELQNVVWENTGEVESAD